MSDITGSSSVAEPETTSAGGGQPPAGGGPEREFTVESRSQSQMVIRRFLHHRLAMVCLIVLIIVILFSLVGGRLWTYSYEEITESFNTPRSGRSTRTASWSGRRSTRWAPTPRATTSWP